MKYTSSILLAFLWMASCTEPQPKTEQPKESAHESHHEHSESIVLNNGSKWKVDEPMMEVILKMEGDVNTFMTSENKDYKAFQVSLQADIDNLTSNCTMKGQAHDELHKWLLPYIDMVELLKNAPNDTDAAAIATQIQDSFKVLHTYFE